MNQHPAWRGSRPIVTNGVAHSHFDVLNAPLHQQLLAWRERVGHVIDVVPSRESLAQPFRGAISRFDIGDITFTDCHTDAVLLERTIARISRDNVRTFAFHVFLHGGAELITVQSAKRSAPTSHDGIMAIDMDQPIRMRRQACRLATIFVPRALLQAVLPDPSALHGRVIERERPGARFIIEQVATLARDIRHMTMAQARDLLADVVQWLIDAFAEQAGLAGNKRALARAAQFDLVRRYVQAHLHNAELSPEDALDTLGLSRPTLYRLFQHEGGLGAYIRHLRLRNAADELVRFPQLPVKDIAYAVGFKSPSDFTRAFRRAYDMAPQDIRLVDTSDH